MRKHLLLGSLFLTGFSFSQITVTDSDLIQPSDLVEQAYDQSNSITHMAAGTDLSWNYSALLEDSTGQFSVGMASWADGYAEFSDANLSGDDNSGQGTLFLRKNTSSLDLLGIYGDPIGTGSNSALKFEPQSRITPLPLTYNTTDQNQYTLDFTIDPGVMGIDSARTKQNVAQDFMADAWGEMTTPLGTFEVVRLMKMQVTIDSTWMYSMGLESLVDNNHDTTYTYSFYTNDANVRYSLVEYDYDPDLGEITSQVTWLKALPTTSLEEVNLNTFSIYPNPAKDELTISSDDVAATYSLVDITGKRVLNGRTGSNGATTINVSNLKRGVYFIKFFDNENFIGTKKLVKQ